MKTFLNILLAILILFTAINLAAMNNEREITKSFSVKQGETLYTDLNQGDIKIKTWEKDEVLIHIHGIDADEVSNISIVYENKVVSIKSEDEMESEGLTLQVTVPTKFNLEIKTRGGNVSVLNEISGSVSVSTYGGDLSFNTVNGNLSAQTNGGNISIDGNVSGILDINTMGGDIRLGTLNGKSAKVNTMGGNISVIKSLSGINTKTYGGDINIGEAGGDSEFITYGGNIEVKNVNGNVRMETNGGNLELKGANGKVKAKTSGGNVEFKNIKGSVDVKTSAGEVEVELDPVLGSQSRISTSAGSIELIIPSSAKVTIEARIHVQGWWKNAKENYKIQSDFKAESIINDDRTQEITGTYVLNGGGSKIFLRSVNDVIVIKKK